MMHLTTTLLGALLALAPAQSSDQRIALEPPPSLDADRSQAAAASEPRLLQLYDVHDLIVPPGRHLEEALLDAEALSARLELKAKRLQLFADAIREHVQPALSKGLDEVSTNEGGVLILTGTAQQHRWTRDFLELQRADLPKILSIDSKYVRADGKDFEAAGFVGPSTVWEGGTELREALTYMQSAPRAFEPVTAPNLTLLTTQEASVSVINQVSYVKSYEVVYVHPGPVAIADPVIDVIDEGFDFRMTAIEIEQGLFALELKFERTEIERPIPTKEVSVAVDTESTVTISQPTVLSSQLSSTVLLRDGASVWFRVPDGERELLILVQLRVHLPIRVSDEPVESEPPPGVDPPRKGRR